MAKKRRGEKPQRELTKRQLSHWQEQQRRQRLILGAGTFIIAATLIILGIGWYTTQYRPLHATAIKINDTEFDMQYYINALNLNLSGQSSEYANVIADATIRTIEQNELIRQAAEKLGITVGDDAVRQKLRSSGLPDDSVHRDLIRTRLLEDKLKADYFDKQVPATANQVNIMAMLLESESQANEVRARLDKGESFADLAGTLSLNPLTKEKKGDLGWHPQDALATLLGSSVPGDYAFGSQAGVLSQPRYDADVIKNVGYWLIKVIEKDDAAKQARVDAMLLGSEQQAQEIRAKLAAGDNFTALAKEFSQLSNAATNGGNLGTLSPGQADSTFDSFTFSPEAKAGTLSDPIRDDALSTKGGYWLINVVEKQDNRAIDEADRNILKGKALDDWVSSLWIDPNNNIDDSYLDDAAKARAISLASKT